MKNWVLAVALTVHMPLAMAAALPADTGLASVPDKQQLQPSFATALLPAPQTTTAYSDLALDGTFGSSPLGMRYYDGNNAMGNNDHTLRVFKADGGGYWVVGVHGHTIVTEPNDALIAKVLDNGTYDTDFGSGGKLWISVPFQILDVAMSPEVASTFYFTGPYTAPRRSDSDFGVYCIQGDSSSLAPCASFGTNGLAYAQIGYRSTYPDLPTRIVATGAQTLYIAGISNTGISPAANIDVSLAELNATSGRVIDTFGDHGTVVHRLDKTPAGVDLALDLAVTYPGSPGGFRVYVAGSTQRNADGHDTDGFVMALDPATGAYDATFTDGEGVGGVVYAFADLGQTNQQDTLTRIKVLSDGSIVVAGQAEDDVGDQQMLLAKFKPNGHRDSSFCDGAVHCTQQFLTTYLRPTGISERPDTHDLVIASDWQDDIYTADHHREQAVFQLGSNGEFHYLQLLDYSSSSGVTPFSSGSDLMVDSHNRVVAAGTRRWDSASNDFDMTVARMVASDTIFANGFDSN